MRSKVLIADDEAFIRLLIQQTLEDFEEEGVDILTAEDGEKALQTIREEKPDLVFLDVMMPKMNGFEVCEAVRHHFNMYDVYIVMLTAKGQEFDRVRGEQVGANIYMTKPFDPDELVNLTQKVLTR
jgi:two-component system, OmpR family, alkaline phosphatase synthesis response regulator PhoP